MQRDDQHTGAPDRSRTLRRLLPVGVVLGLLLIVVVLADLSSPRVTQVPLPSFTPQPPAPIFEGPEPVPTTPEPGSDMEFSNGPQNNAGTIFTVVVWIIVIGGAIAGIVWFLRRFSFISARRLRASTGVRSGELDEEEAAEEVREAIRAGIDDLDDASVDPRRAVIACWLRLESAAAIAGTPKEPADTPTDLVVRMLSRHRVTARSLHRIAALYRRARYSPDEVGEDMRTEARATLSAVLAELNRPRAETGAE